MSEEDDLGGAITRIGRAIRAHLSPLTGERATGQARVKSVSGTVLLQPNTYAIPVIEGAAHEELLVKVQHNPATVQAHKQGGAWSVDEAGVDVTFVANNGGALFNFPAGTRLRFSPAIPGLVATAEVPEPGFTGGLEGAVKQIVAFDDIGGPEEEMALFQARVSGVPALVLAWMQSTPVEGRTGGLSQGATRKGRGVRAYFETWAIYVVTADATSLEARRTQGLKLMEATRAILSDRRVNDDGETLSTMGTGIEVQASTRLSPRRESAARFMVSFRLVRIQQVQHTRSFKPWLSTQVESFIEAKPPGNPDELVLHAPIDDMPEE